MDPSAVSSSRRRLGRILGRASRQLAWPQPTEDPNAVECVVGKFHWTLADGVIDAKITYNGTIATTVRLQVVHL